ncbi:MAG: intradiol ring-cleavage dioxygenase [Candidatus Rokuibacteriota bacterium]
MTRDHTPRPHRRDFLSSALALPALTALVARPADAQSGTLAPTPSCVEKGQATPSQTAGPFFKPRSPRRVSLLEPGMAGMRIIVAGVVLSTACRPIPGALLDVWHADDRGEYDNAGYRLRGHQFADEQGRYRLETIVPGVYTGRTRHFHVRVQAPNQPVLTTQLYFPDEPANRSDGIFRPELVLSVKAEAGIKAGAFDFVLAVPA